MPDPQPSPRVSALETLASRRKQLAIGLWVAAGLLAFAGIRRFIDGSRIDGTFYLLLAILMVVAGVWQSAMVPPEAAGAADRMRMFIVIVGGITGLLITILAVSLGISWWNDILLWLQPGGPDAMVSRDTRWTSGGHAIYVAIALLLGLGIMLLCLQLGRADERSNASLRRLVYGYNAVVAGVLLLLILATANLYIGLRFTKPLDFTATGLYTVSDRAANLVRTLERPVKVYVLLDRRTSQGFENHIRTMLTNMQELNGRISWEEMSAQDDLQLQHLREKYAKKDFGLLIEYGDGERREYQFIRQEDLAEAGGRPGQPPAFKGEDALMSALTFLMEGKKPVLYFTQGNGELDIKARDTRNGGGLLAERLEKRNYEVKPLQFGLKVAEVPADASAVIILGPQGAMSETAVKALDQYMGARRGKMLVMLDTTIDNETATGYPRTGLESLLTRYNVELPNERLFSWPADSFYVIQAVPNPMQEQNPLVAPFKGKTMTLVTPRPVKPGAAASPMAPSRMRAESLLINSPRQDSFVEPKLNVDLQDLYRRLGRNRDELARRVQESQNTSLAVGVVESAAAPMHPGLPPMPGAGQDTPRLVVLGNSKMASNEIFAQGVSRLNFDFIASSIDWLREKPNVLGIEAKKMSTYALPADKLTTLGFGFVLLPVAVIMLSVVGTGAAVWLVRRR